MYFSKYYLKILRKGIILLRKNKFFVLNGLFIALILPQNQNNSQNPVLFQYWL